MNEQPTLPTPEDRALLAALAELEGGAAAAASPTAAAGREPPPGSDGEESGGAAGTGTAGGGDAAEAETETLARLYHETLGLVPFALPPAAPRPELRRRLLERAGAAATRRDATAGERAQPATAEPAAGVVPLRTAAAVGMADPAVARTAAGAVAGTAGPGAAGTAAGAAAGPAGRAAAATAAAAAAKATPSRWPLALAAALILALLGTCGWLYLGLREQGATIARLAAQRDLALRRAGEVEDRLARLSRQVSNMRDSFSVVTSPAVEVCNLRAVAPEQGAAGGILFVAADHQHWYMSLRGLRPPGEGKVYQLWFVADQGAVSGGTFSARPGAPAELGSERMPAGTRAVRITLEKTPGSSAPSGPDVLRSADALHTL